MAGNIAYLEPMPKDLDEPAQGIELGRNCSPLLFDFVQDGLAALEKKTGIKYWSNVTMVYEAKAAVACLIFRGEPVVGGRK